MKRHSHAHPLVRVRGVVRSPRRSLPPSFLFPAGAVCSLRSTLFRRLNLSRRSRCHRIAFTLIVVVSDDGDARNCGAV